jgi:hypothetical protein
MPFTDHTDVVRRLLPYHIYCQPHEDLELLKENKGKQKATDAELKAEIKGIMINHAGYSDVLKFTPR